MSSVLQQHPKKVLCLFVACLAVVVALVVELALRLFLPYRIATIGHLEAPNALLYGWGFKPNERISITDPDTGEVFVSRANSRGWRDKERSFANPAKAYRILVIGDSGTFGAIVPADKIYTRVLEDRLVAAGYNAEVINISYGGWGSDQELEALVHEGVKYKPNLVIVQFCTNDLTDNAYFRLNEQDRKGIKPFYYDLDAAGKLVRHENPYFDKRTFKSWKDYGKFIIAKSEILKRIYAIRLRWKLAEMANINTDKKQPPKYSVGPQQLKMLQLELKLEPDAPLLAFLRPKQDQPLSDADVAEAIRVHGREQDAGVIKRVLEHRWFHRYWSEDEYYRRVYLDVESPMWRLYFALMARMRDVAQHHGAKLALLSVNEIGHYNWSRSWFRVSDDAETRRKYFLPTAAIEKFAAANGIEFIDNVMPYQRARNDPHPTIEGNRAMAESIYQYLMKRHKAELDAHRAKQGKRADG